MDVNGMHLAEAGHMDDFDASLAVAGGHGSVTMLHTIIDRYPYLREHYPELRVNLRFYTGDWTVIRPRHWARENFALMQSYGMVGDANLTVFGANEMDLACESGGTIGAGEGRPNNLTIAEYDRIFAWQYAYVDEVQGLKATHGGRFRVGCLAGADGHEPAGYPPDYQYTLPSCRQVVDRADVIWGHAYAELGDGADPTADVHMWHALRPLRPAGYQQDIQGLPLVGGLPDPGGFRAQYPDKPYVMTEAGNGRHGDITVSGETFAQLRMIDYAYAAAGCEGVTWFIFNAGANHGMARFVGSPNLVNALVAMERIPVVQQGGGTVATLEEKVNQLLQQNHDIVEALIALREGRFTGAGSVDGWIAALRGGTLPANYRPVFPKA